MGQSLNYRPYEFVEDDLWPPIIGDETFDAYCVDGPRFGQLDFGQEGSGIDDFDRPDPAGVSSTPVCPTHNSSDDESVGQDPTEDANSQHVDPPLVQGPLQIVLGKVGASSPTRRTQESIDDLTEPLNEPAPSPSIRLNNFFQAVKAAVPKGSLFDARSGTLQVFMKAVVERVFLGEKVTHNKVVGRRLQDLRHFLDSKKEEIEPLLAMKAVQVEVLQLLLCVLAGGNVAKDVTLSGSYKIEFDRTSVKYDA
jgi:hypothetical protein